MKRKKKKRWKEGRKERMKEGRNPHHLHDPQSNQQFSHSLWIWTPHGIIKGKWTRESCLVLPFPLTEVPLIFSTVAHFGDWGIHSLGKPNSLSFDSGRTLGDICILFFHCPAKSRTVSGKVFELEHPIAMMVSHKPAWSVSRPWNCVVKWVVNKVLIRLKFHGFLGLWILSHCVHGTWSWVLWTLTSLQHITTCTSRTRVLSSYKPALFFSLSCGDKA